MFRLIKARLISDDLETYGIVVPAHSDMHLGMAPRPVSTGHYLMLPTTRRSEQFRLHPISDALHDIAWVRRSLSFRRQSTVDFNLIAEPIPNWFKALRQNRRQGLQAPRAQDQPQLG